MTNLDIDRAMTIKLGEIFHGELPPLPVFQEEIRRAPKREFTLTKEETALALRVADGRALARGEGCERVVCEHAVGGRR